MRARAGARLELVDHGVVADAGAVAVGWVELAGVAAVARVSVMTLAISDDPGNQ